MENENNEKQKKIDISGIEKKSSGSKSKKSTNILENEKNVLKPSSL